MFVWTATDALGLQDQYLRLSTTPRSARNSPRSSSGARICHHREFEVYLQVIANGSNEILIVLLLLSKATGRTC